MIDERLISFLNEKYTLYHHPRFWQDDPLLIPHQYSAPADIEIAGFFAATLAWGQRTTIIHKTNTLMALMDQAPHAFITQHQPSDLKPFLSFVHRTFNATDVLYFIQRLQQHYARHTSLETAFLADEQPPTSLKDALIYFHNYFFSGPHPARTRKHLSTPLRHSACKRLCMYLRWMVRKDDQHIDFGLWQKIKPSQLICPLDVHVARVAHRLQLIPRPAANWQMAEALTNQLRILDATDPVKYDFALFGLGRNERF